MRVNLLDSYPKSERHIVEMSRSTPENQAVSKQFGYEYFDGDRKYGYGGYYYDGRWKPIARRMIQYYELHKYAYVLDIGCAKGFLVKDLRELGISAYGLDISEYAINKADKETRSYLRLCDARQLPYRNKEFDLVICINVIHNFNLEDCKQVIREISRIGKYAYIQVDSWFTEQQKENLMKWKLTAETIMAPEEWEILFKECNYKGDYFFTIAE